jgi:hypothetical protein
MERNHPDPGAVPLRDPDTAEAEAAAAAMQALGRAARAFVLYDPGNKLVHQFLGDFREKMRAALSSGELRVEIRPFELVQDEVALYREADRERSLAFRLYRDGVRRLTFKPGVPWEELLTLLGILAVRFTSVRQQEEDLVTLLRKAEFQGISVQAVAGFVPDEANPEPEVETPIQLSHHTPPPDWDLPMPQLSHPAALAWRELPAEALTPLRQDESIEASAGWAFTLARDLLANAIVAGWPAPHAELAQFFVELRDVLLGDGRLDAVRQLMDLVQSARQPAIRDALFAALADPKMIDTLLEKLPEETTQLAPEHLALVPALKMDVVLDRLVAPGSRRALLLQLAEALLPQGADVVAARLPSLEQALAERLMRALVAKAPRQAVEAGRRLLAKGDEAMALLGLVAIEASESVPMGPLVALLGSRTEALRIRAAEVLGRKGDETAVPPVRQALEEPGSRTLKEAEALGRALAELAPIPAARLFGAWLDPKSRLLRGVPAAQRFQQWAAVSGLAALPDAMPDAQLEAVAQRSSDELRGHCLAALALRRKARSRG